MVLSSSTRRMLSYVTGFLPVRFSMLFAPDWAENWPLMLLRTGRLCPPENSRTGKS